MASSDAASGKKNDSAAGEKHEMEHENSEAKPSKQQKTQTKLEDHLEQDGDDDEDRQDNDANADDDGNDIKDNEEGENVENQKSKKGESSQEDNETANTGAEKPGEEKDMPSNVLEKGIIYFFIRGRVNIDKPEQVDDIARSYMILRPIARDAKLGSGTIGDAGNTRILALPKKVLPQSGKDRFMVFVDKTDASFQEIKTEFLASSDYETKTAGTRHTPAATPVGEGVYVLTSTGRETHLAYMITLPEKLGEVQKGLGVKEKGSFIVSTKNPEYPGPANAQLPEGPGFSKEIIQDFRSLRWAPTQAEHLNYVNCQVLLVGESSGLDKAMEPQGEDQENGNEEPLEALEHLEDEDLKRMKHLPGDQSASIFADLEVRAKDYPKLQTTF